MVTSTYFPQGNGPLIRFISPLKIPIATSYHRLDFFASLWEEKAFALLLHFTVGAVHTQMGVIIDVDPPVIKIDLTKRIC